MLTAPSAGQAADAAGALLHAVTIVVSPRLPIAQHAGLTLQLTRAFAPWGGLCAYPGLVRLQVALQQAWHRQHVQPAVLCAGRMCLDQAPGPGPPPQSARSHIGSITTTLLRHAKQFPLSMSQGNNDSMTSCSGCISNAICSLQQALAPAGPQQLGCACREGLHPGACPGASERPQRAHSAWAGWSSLLGRPASFWRWLAPLTAQPQAPPHLQGLHVCWSDTLNPAGRLSGKGRPRLS